MKFIIEKEVIEKYPDLIIYIPIIKGFDNTKGREESVKLLRECEAILRGRFRSVEELLEDRYISPYFDMFRSFGANPKKIKPTHFALAKRVLEGMELPDINPIVNIYNALSIKYLTPYGGEDLETVYGDFRLKFSEGNEHWKGIGKELGINPPKGSLIWVDDFDVSTVALNWRQCERTKLRETSNSGYFIMDGFESVNDENIRTGASELVGIVMKLCGGKSEVIKLTSTNPSVEVDFDTKSIEGIETPKVVSLNGNKAKVIVEKKKVEYAYEVGTVEDLIQTLLAKQTDKLKKQILVSRIVDKKFGDFTSPIAMQMAKEQGKNPLEIAIEIVEKLSKDSTFSKVDAVKPGYINFFLASDHLKNSLLVIDEKFGTFDEGAGQQIMVEYGQPNTHKSITVGHVKSAITGLSVARLFEALGYDVIHANYFGDLGPYVAKTLYVLMQKNGITNNKELTDLGVDKCMKYLTEIQERLGFKGVKDEIGLLYRTGNKMSESNKEDEVAIKAVNSLLFNKTDENLNRLYKESRDVCIEYQTDFFKILGVKYDRQYPESEVFEIGKQVVKENIGNLFIEDKGAIIFPGEKYNMGRWVFLTSEGNPTYHGKDLGLVNLKFKEYPNLKFCLIMTSVEQNEYFKALMKVVSILYPHLDGKYLHEGFGWLLFNNKKTSSRGGSFTFDDMYEQAVESAKAKIAVLKEYTDTEKEKIAHTIAMSGIKFNILSHEFHKDINYDPKNFTSLSGYSAPYIIYSFTRAMSVLEKGGGAKEFKLEKAYNEKEETDLIRKLLEYPKVVKTSAKDRKTHILCEYLYELANTFNSFYTTQSILNTEDEDIKNSRLLLAKKTAMIIKKGLYLLGIDTIDKM